MYKLTFNELFGGFMKEVTITISGDKKSGKTTIAKIITEALENFRGSKITIIELDNV